MDNLSDKKLSFWPQLLLFFGLFLALLRKINDPDIWFHMVIGRETLKQWAIPQTEFYIFPVLGNPAEFHEFGFGVLYQLVYNLGGYTGMAIVNSLLATFTLIFLYRAATVHLPKFNGPAVLVLGLAAFCLDFRLVYRPETVLFLCLAIEIFCLERFAASSRVKWLWPIPVAAWMLSQMHPSTLIMQGVLAMYFCQFIGQNQPLKLTRRHLALIFGAVSVTMLVLASINPFGFKQIYLPLQTLFGSMKLQSGVNEFLPVLRTEFKYNFIAIALLGALAIGLLPQRRIVHTLLYLVFGWLAYRYVRNLGLFAIVMYVPVASLAQYLSQKYLNSMWARFTPLALPAALAVVLVLPISEGRWGRGPIENGFPEISVKVIQYYLADGNVLNFYHLGGYLAWALGNNFKMAVDGHFIGINPATEFHNSVIRTDPGWQAKLDSYQVNTIVVPAIVPVHGLPLPILTALAQDDSWALVTAEPAAMIFMRRSVLPYNTREYDKSTIWKKMIYEAQQNVVVYPGFPGTYKALGMAYRALGDWENAAINEQKYLRLTGKNNR